MNRDKWLTTLEKIRKNFALENEYQESLGENIPGVKWVVEFTAGELGKIRMEWVEKPRLKEVKTTYSNRIGSGTKVENVYEETELTNYLNVFKWDTGSQAWEKMGAELINI